MTLDEMRNILLDMNICTEDELNLVIDIVGDGAQTYEDILYAREGYRDFDTYLEDWGFEYNL